MIAYNHIIISVIVAKLPYIIEKLVKISTYIEKKKEIKYQEIEANAAPIKQFFSFLPFLFWVNLYINKNITKRLTIEITILAFIINAKIPLKP